MHADPDGDADPAGLYWLQARLSDLMYKVGCSPTSLLPAVASVGPVRPEFWCSSMILMRLSCPLQVTAQKFEDPANGEEAVTKKLDEINEQIKESFRNLEEDYR
jgi:hypothetical protein